MGVSMEAIDEALEVQLPGLRAKVTGSECGLELTRSVEAAALVLPKHVEHLGDTCKGVFGPVKGVFS